MKTVMSKGTLSDKVAAYTVLVQDDPVCNLSTIQNMVNLVKVGKKKECLIVMGAFHINFCLVNIEFPFQYLNFYICF